MSNRAKKAKDELENLQRCVLAGGATQGDIKRLRENAENLLEAERMLFAQKGNWDFVKCGDRCSKFFHDLIKRNNKRNMIMTITKHDGNVTSTND